MALYYKHILIRPLFGNTSVKYIALIHNIHLSRHLSSIYNVYIVRPRVDFRRFANGGQRRRTAVADWFMLVTCARPVYAVDRFSAGSSRREQPVGGYVRDDLSLEEHEQLHGELSQCCLESCRGGDDADETPARHAHPGDDWSPVAAWPRHAITASLHTRATATTGDSPRCDAT